VKAFCAWFTKSVDTHHRQRSQLHAAKHRYEGIQGRGEGKEQESGRAEEAEQAMNTF